MRAAPIKRVTVTDARPWLNDLAGDGDRPWHWSNRELRSDERGELPRAIFLLIDAGRFGGFEQRVMLLKSFPTEGDARLALSDALLRWAKAAPVPAKIFQEST